MSTMRRDTGKYPNRGCDNTLCTTQLPTVHHSWIIITPSKTRGMDSPATPVGLSPPLLSLVLRNEPCYTKDGDLAGDGMVGCDFGGHEHVEDDETNPTVLTLEPNDERRRPATGSSGGAASVDGGDGAPVTGDSGERAAELHLAPANPTVVTATGGDDGGDGAARMELGRRRRRGGARGGGATRHGRPRKRGQTKEED
uniref:Retrotransposon protein, putative, unclassified n=2 Tax=Oryza sativa subsp. japonica TaxID=39947 RepID=Q2R957_ORYSJ|nr:retrotransposon protein, putative, unclassified [Oryza sativa Japonica Group]ABA91979.1 retrotransposon protein, putative, unclassified [Oryza sativa Japonica Group]